MSSLPKIVYPSGGANTLQFAYWPRFYTGGYRTTRHDNVASSGVQERIWERTDVYLMFSMEYVKGTLPYPGTGSDLLNWDTFVQYALKGGAFDYYPDPTGTPTDIRTCFLEHTNYEPKWKSLGMITFDMVFRYRVGWPSAPPGGLTTPVTSFSDTFTRADGDLGINWLSQMRDNAGNSGTNWPRASISSNKLLIQTGGNNNVSLNQAVWIPQQVIFTDPNTLQPGGIWGANQWVQITFQSMSTTGSGMRAGIGLFTKINEGNSVNEATAYVLAVRYSSSGFAAVEVIHLVGGQNEPGNTFTVLGSSATALSAGDVLRFEGSYSGGIATLVYKRNGTQMLSVTDSSPIPKIGWPCIDEISALGVCSATFTNFSCGLL